jgi:hypothetical protein
MAANRLKSAGAKAAIAEALKAVQSAGSDETGALNQALLSRLEGQETAAQSGLAKAARESNDPIVRYLAAVELAQAPPQ